jgi:hypothetical protein
MSFSDLMLKLFTQTPRLVRVAVDSLAILCYRCRA